ncbi:type I restriction-modification system, DNA-methyltransferase subunit M [Porphyromonas crevioricanis JCM 15906]|uniref:site-specific DNA-methyltransferase (adenine-specific) n=2 Tax=Porphyromonas crevioricanis TaxID=393921 RepID=A0A2X4PFP9_9PORP|nr:class I SAM-dependent DNA methyltransferase [Porphyromonas crevioricanis]GAD04967.1 type I restriction-modification system, DNA-methyltransferase subunit M [Porphyromonas crevioricanis JCM 15906]GAD07479.1 type I restriction-modification system, DNA-methyltransferase subunit M [Porphyromonas crevioricanis JCM 13913]SKA05567.1 type I restriction enzyme M protein [Porphyromonas crevioricanis]SQH72654.1 Probable type I restriction enzyme BthVORF4518P M protein [Porphyromonas crevioricanis]
MALNNFVKSIRNIMRNDAGINGDAQRIEQIAWMLFLKIYDEKENDWEFNEDNYQSFIPGECRWRSWAKDEGDGNALTADALLGFVNNTLFPTLKSLEVTPETPVRSRIVRTTFEDANQYMKDGVLLRQIINIIDDLNLSDYNESHAFGEIYETILKEMQSAGSAGEFYTPRALTDFMAEIINPQIGEKMADFACGTGGFITSWLKALDKKVQETNTADAQKEYANSIYGIEKKQFPYMLCVTNMLLHGIEAPLVLHDNSLNKDVLNYTEGDKFDVVLMNPPYGGSEKNDIKQHFPSDLSSSETADLFMVLIMYRLKKSGRAAVILPDGFLFGADNAKLAIKEKLLREFNLHTIVRLPGSIFAPYTSIATNILFFNNEQAEGAEEGFCTQKTWFYRLDMPEGYKHFSKTKPMRSEHCEPLRTWWHNRTEIVSEDGKDEKARAFSAQDLLTLSCNFDQCKFPKEEEEILAPAELLESYYKRRLALEHEIDKTLAEVQRILGIDINTTEQ